MRWHRWAAEYTELPPGLVPIVLFAAEPFISSEREEHPMDLLLALSDSCFGQIHG